MTGTLRQLDSKYLRVAMTIAFFVFFAAPLSLHAQNSEDFDQYKLRIDGFWFYSNPSGTIRGNVGTSQPIDFQKDLGFNTYSTVAGKVDWKFTRKNHFYVAFSPFYTSRQTILTRDITFQGQTFQAGLTVKSDLHAFLVAPGYQYDIIRRKRGHLGLGLQIDLFNSSAKITGTGQISGGGSGTVSAKGSLLAPIPVAGPEFRLYLTNSPRLFVEGNVFGMYLFGYGNFVSSVGTVGLTLNKHVSVNAGYQLGSRLNVNGTSSRIGLGLTQKGAIAGMEVSF